MVKPLLNFLKGVALAPLYIAVTWLLIAGTFQSYQSYRWATMKLEQVQQIKAAATNPLTLFTKDDD